VDLINESKMEFAFAVGKIVPPQHTISLIVKGTFDMIHGSPVVLSGKQMPPSGDIYYPDDAEMAGAPWYESDFAYFKPRADLLLVGHCHAPEGFRFQASQATFRVGHIEKRLKIFGDRYWKRGLLGAYATDPEPASAVTLRYENSFGGAEFDSNPVGKGYAKQLDASGQHKRLLPNILAEADHLDGPRQKVSPAGFGPLGKFWQPRKSKLGTYKGEWLKNRWPWFPDDFDWGFYNAAPQDLQMEGYLVGNETIYCENLHPQHAQYTAELPGLRARCFVEKQTGTEEAPTFDEVTMRLDTLWVDMDAEKLVLVWRGWTTVRDEDLEEIGHIMVTSEKTDADPHPAAYYEKRLAELLKARDKEWELEEPVASESTVIDMTTENENAEKTYREALERAGIGPDNYPPPLSEKAKEEEKQILKDYGIELPLYTDQRITLPLLFERLSQQTAVCGEDLRHLDLSGKDLKGADLSDSIFSRANLSRANLSQSRLVAGNLAQADLSEADMQNADLSDADFSGANLTGADLSGAILKDTLFEGADLTNAKLHDIDGQGADFSNAVLTGAEFDNAVLCQSEFTKGRLDNTRFCGADLSEASLRGARGSNANLDKATLTELRASDGCTLIQCSFRQVSAKESIWDQSTLDRVDFSHADLTGANFSNAHIRETLFHSAVCRSVRFTKAHLDQANFNHSDLFEALLDKAAIKDTDFNHANMFAAEFLDAEMDHVQFYGTNLKRTKLEKK
jgi:uncharacterized protein YjbI with pentapeptide repeats